MPRIDRRVHPVAGSAPDAPRRRLGRVHAGAPRGVRRSDAAPGRSRAAQRAGARLRPERESRPRRERRGLRRAAQLRHDRDARLARAARRRDALGPAHRRRDADEQPGLAALAGDPDGLEPLPVRSGARLEDEAHLLRRGHRGRLLPAAAAGRAARRRRLRRGLRPRLRRGERLEHARAQPRLARGRRRGRVRVAPRQGDLQGSQGEDVPRSQLRSVHAALGRTPTAPRWPTTTRPTRSRRCATASCA